MLLSHLMNVIVVALIAAIPGGIILAFLQNDPTWLVLTLAAFILIYAG